MSPNGSERPAERRAVIAPSAYEPRPSSSGVDGGLSAEAKADYDEVDDASRGEPRRSHRDALDSTFRKEPAPRDFGARRGGAGDSGTTGGGGAFML